jgi:hypothetical protein
MKKAYTAPKAEAIDFYMEGAVAIALMSGSTDPKGGMWDNMN